MREDEKKIIFLLFTACDWIIFTFFKKIAGFLGIWLQKEIKNEVK